MSVPSSLHVNFQGLDQAAAVTREDQDRVVLGHNRIPVAGLGKGGGGAAVGKSDFFGQRDSRLIVTDDNQGCDHYDAADHCNGQNRHQPSQKAQVRWFGELIIGGVVHV